ncbi:thioredoxin family protein [Psychroflexus montanilacus]|uniref:thioredoxin family protein n=1 Tax=Psychroflexus montanilacus TaxID=2873598 RepID=UPI001CC93A6D|nr:thioredoxin family protein [Psychroflexus montanilacus]MBZ9652366.1 thioredoxin family protein [Psychroflexus montanilacus]
MSAQHKLEIIKKHLDKTLSYSEYKNLVETLLKKGKSTGFTQNEAFLNYSKLGFNRMKRWEKTSELTEDQIQKIKKVKQKQTWLVITEGWCGDAAPVIPIMKKIADHNPLIDFKLILRDDNDELMSQFLTNGGKSIPKLISFNLEEEEILFTWGPRPKEAADLVAKEKAEFGKLRDKFKMTLQKWYNQDKGKNIAEDLVNCLALNV